MRAWLAIVASVLVVAGAVLYVSEAQRSTADQGFAQARVGERLRSSLVAAELALDQAATGARTDGLSALAAAQATLRRNLGEARALAGGDAIELAALERQEAAAADWERRAAPQIERLRANEGEVRPQIARRLHALEAFLAANTRYEQRVDELRRARNSRAALVPVEVIGALSALFLLIGGVVVRRSRRARERAALAERRRLEDEQRAELMQRRLAEALQVAADQNEAHALVRDHLETALPGSEVHILNRNNSADRLEASTELADSSPLAQALVTSRPRSCVAVRLSRPFSRRAGSDEVLACELCGKLEGESSCRPLLVGGEVIGSVLVRRPGGLGDEELRRVDASVTSAAPVLANLRNLAIAEMRAATDALTGLPNRRSLDDTLKRMLAQASRSVSPLALLLADLDHFKQVNDTFGHEKGDGVLAGFGALLRSQLRASDFAARSGGEEFVVLLPDTDREGALQLAEKLRRSVHGLRVEGVDRRTTVSMGLAVFPDDAVDEETLQRLADRALYSAKQHGRDRVETVSATAQEPVAGS